MADCSKSSETQVLHFHSQSLPPELGWEKKNVIDQLFEDTESFDDAIALDCSFNGTPLVTFDPDIEVVDDTDCIENAWLPQQITEYEKEVVLDSEDEGNSYVKLDRRTEGNAVGSQRRQPAPPSPHLDDFKETYVGSIVGEHCGTEQVDESTDAGKIHPPMLTHDQVFAELNYIGSEEPRESSQANALDFVNHYLSLNNVDSSPGTKPRNAIRKKTSPVSRIKGCQSLAKQIKTGTAVGNDGIFEWVDNDHCGRIDFFSKRTGTALGHGGSQQRSVKGHQKFGRVESKEASCSGKKLQEKSRNLIKEVTASCYSDSRPAVGRAKEINRFEQASETNFENVSVKNSNEQSHEVQLGRDIDAYNTEENAPDTFDVGFGTQMAAEAMEALSYGLPTDICAGNVSQCPQSSRLDPSPGIEKSKIHFRSPCLQKGAFSNSEGIARMSKQRERYASSSRAHSSYQELDNELEITTRRKRVKSLAGKLNGMNSMYQNEFSARESAKPVKKRKVGEENTKECEDCGSSSIPFESILLGKECIHHGEPVTQETGRWIREGKLEGKKDGSDNLGYGMNDAVKGSTITYKRKRSSVHANAKPSGILNVGGNCTKEKPFTHQRHWITGDELEGTKDGPDGAGERMNAITKGKIITYKRKRSAKVFELTSAEGKSIKLCCNISEVSRNNKLIGQKQGSLEVSSLTGSLDFNAWSCPKGKRMPRRRPSHLNEANNPSILCIKIDRKEGHKKPYNKILPKSSLLKELIRLGIQEPKPDFTWKDLRKRRDMSHVQVLFSQHLDDDIIKQQKKITARLGISIASCSMNATHFIADKFVRTRNMFEAIAHGKPVVTHLWLESCGQASCLIDEKNYILRDAKKEKEIGFSMPASLARASQHPLLKGRRVLITPNIKPDVEMITSLIKAVHGQAVQNFQISDLKIPDDLLILSCEEDHSICVPFLDKGAAVYSSELLLNGIVIQKFEYERHQLFTNRAKRSGRPGTR
ncbi:uncharacterized protein LOC8272072 isoform X2 [Ricinus communis]|uniref:uncharacterized protein LOC8272072 isoform X2 n=1 Tax=Ricinus communis TaxID=3988 RepID=UPI00201A6A35|nr:uncharacterized protein LOC8272072 isoform X2 [Ricinus communis]